MRRLLLVVALVMLACSLAGCPFFTRSEATNGAPAPAAEPGHQ